MTIAFSYWRYRNKVLALTREGVHCSRVTRAAGKTHGLTLRTAIVRTQMPVI